MKSDLSARDWQLLSAYLDHQLNARERSRLEARLAIDPGLRQSLHSLEQIKLALRTAPRRKSPRDFTLEPKTAPSRSTPVLFPMLSFASLSSALLFVVLMLSGSPSGLLQGQFFSTEGSAPAAVMLADSIQEVESLGEDAELPPIINWGAPGLGSAMGAGGGGDSGAAAETMDEGIPPAPLPILEDVQENITQPEGEFAAELAVEAPTPNAEVEESPQEKEAHSPATPAAGEPMPDPQAPQELAENPREITKTDQPESDPMDIESSTVDNLPGGPILGIKPSSTPAQDVTQAIEGVGYKRPTIANAFFKWLLATAAFIFGLGAALIWRKSH